MADGHEHFEELAVGHVLGGLDAATAAEFRSHLVRCRICQDTVAELRDIASELAAAEKDERQRERQRVRTETTRRASENVPPPATRRGPRLVVATVVVLLAAAGGLAFWNLHLRTTVDVYGDVAEQRGDALRTLGGGTIVPVELGHGVTGVVTMDDRHAAFSLGGLPALSGRQRIAVWLEGVSAGDEGGTTGAVLVLVAFAGQLDDGVFAARVETTDADQLVVSLEEGELGAGPSEHELARATLRSTAEDG